MLTCSFPPSTFHLQLVVRYKKTKSCQQQQQQQQKLPTGNWLTLKGSTSQVRKLLFVFCSSFLSLPPSLSSAATCSCLGHCWAFCCYYNCCNNCRSPKPGPGRRPAQSSILITYAIYLLPCRKYCAIVYCASTTRSKKEQETGEGGQKWFNMRLWSYFSFHNWLASYGHAMQAAFAGAVQVRFDAFKRFSICN